jgi:hypothetical protein
MRPPGVVARALAISPVFTVRMRAGVSPSCAAISLRSLAKGPTPARMTPQPCASHTGA